MLAQMIHVADLTSADDVLELSDALEDAGRMEEAEACRADSPFPLVRFVPWDGVGVIVARLRAIEIHGREHRDGTFTQYNVRVHVNGLLAHASPNRYGSSYVAAGFEWLESHGLLPGLTKENDPWGYLYGDVVIKLSLYVKRTGIRIDITSTDVAKLRDL